MVAVDPKAFEYVLSQISDGRAFERFAQDLLCQILGHSFVPLGGIHDRGIDGLDHTFLPSHEQKSVYQASIEADPLSKVRRTIIALQKNSIQFARLIYVTNRTVAKQDVLAEMLYKDYEVVVIFRDSQWLRGHINENEGAIRYYYAFVKDHFNEMAAHDKQFQFADFATDPRVFVFLRQQFDEYSGTIDLNILLVDSLILYALEGTDPDRRVLMSRDEILTKIAALVSYSPKNIEALLDKRLRVLSSKPSRKVRHHTVEDEYCLPHETRMSLQEKALTDTALHASFSASVGVRIRSHLGMTDSTVELAQQLLMRILNELFKQQGLEFADFVLRAENNERVEKCLDVTPIFWTGG